MTIYPLIIKHIQMPLSRLQPVFSPSTLHKTLADKQLLTLRVGFIDGTIHLMQHNIVEKIFNAQSQSRLGIALLAKRLVDEDAQSSAAIETVVVEDVDTTNGRPAFIQVDHQTELLVAEQVIVAQQELLDLKTSVRHMRPTNPPDVAVVLPKEDLTGVLGLGTTERYRVILDEHFVQFVEISTFPSRLAHNLIVLIR